MKEYFQLMKEDSTRKDVKQNLPPLMVAYGANDPHDFIIEVVSRIRSRSVECLGPLYFTHGPFSFYAQLHTKLLLFTISPFLMSFCITVY